MRCSKRCSDHGQLVAAMADPGVGKSRLFHEFKLISQSGVADARGRCILVRGCIQYTGTVTPGFLVFWSGHHEEESHSYDAGQWKDHEKNEAATSRKRIAVADRQGRRPVARHQTYGTRKILLHRYSSADRSRSRGAAETGAHPVARPSGKLRKRSADGEECQRQNRRTDRYA